MVFADPVTYTIKYPCVYLLFLLQGYLLLKDCHQSVRLLPKSIPKGSVLIHKSAEGWLLMDNSSIRVSCTSSDVLMVPPVLLPLIVPLDNTTRLELLIKNVSLLYKIAALQVGDEILVKINDGNVVLKSVIRYRGAIPNTNGEHFGVELLV